MTDWTDDRKAQLRALWDEGHSASVIAECMGTTKNAIIGVAHRIRLPARPSPIRPAGSGKRPPRQYWRRKRPAQPKVTLPPIDQDAPPLAVNAVLRQSRAPQVFRHPPPTPKPPEMGFLAPLPCCWPIGEPRTPSFHFCQAPALPGKPYCRSHCQLAYGRVRASEATV